MYTRTPRDILEPTKPTFTCSKSSIEALEKGMQYLTRTTSMTLLCFAHISHFPLVLLIYFEQVNVQGAESLGRCAW